MDYKKFETLEQAEEFIEFLREHIAGIEDERNIYLDYFDYIGVEPGWITTFVRTLNNLEIDWESNDE